MLRLNPPMTTPIIHTIIIRIMAIRGAGLTVCHGVGVGMAADGTAATVGMDGTVTRDGAGMGVGVVDGIMAGMVAALGEGAVGMAEAVRVDGMVAAVGIIDNPSHACCCAKPVSSSSDAGTLS